MELIKTDAFAEPGGVLTTDSNLRVVSWNINRGTQFARVVEALRTLNPDLVFLQEVDHVARRTAYRNIAAEIAEALRMNYVFGSEFQELAEGSAEKPAFHGQATLCRWPIATYRILRFDDQSRFWQPRWFIPTSQLFQRRTGGRMALVVRIEFLGAPLITYNLHLESRGDSSLRIRQMDQVLLDSYSYAETVPVLIAGDFNCDLGEGPIGARLAKLRVASGRDDSNQGTTRSKWRQGPSIDWILVKGPMALVTNRVHREFDCSDHFPISATMQSPKPADSPSCDER